MAALYESIKRHGTILDATLFPYDTDPSYSACPDGIEDFIARQANQAGVPISAGTDDDFDWKDPYSAFDTELVFLVRRAGMTPAEAIRSATAVGARAAGIEKDAGSIEVGKFADFVILAKDPLTNRQYAQCHDGGEAWGSLPPIRLQTCLGAQPQARHTMIIRSSGGAWPRAILLDLDGTLIDSDHAHQWAFGQILAPHGVVLTTQMFEKIVVGNNNETIMQGLVPHLDPREREMLAIAKEKLVLQNLHLIELCAGARALVQRAADAGSLLAVVTNAPRENAAAILSHFDLLSSIATLVALEDTEAPKPSPAPYREAMRRLRSIESETVAFEDSVAGVTSAAGAGIRVYGVRGYRPEDALLQAGAFACIASLSDALQI